MSMPFKQPMNTLTSFSLLTLLTASGCTPQTRLADSCKGIDPNSVAIFFCAPHPASAAYAQANDSPGTTYPEPNVYPEYRTILPYWAIPTSYDKKKKQRDTRVIIIVPQDAPHSPPMPKLRRY